MGAKPKSPRLAPGAALGSAPHNCGPATTAISASRLPLPYPLLRCGDAVAAPWHGLDEGAMPARSPPERHERANQAKEVVSKFGHRFRSLATSGFLRSAYLSDTQIRERLRPGQPPDTSINHGNLI